VDIVFIWGVCVLRRCRGGALRMSWLFSPLARASDVAPILLLGVDVVEQTQWRLVHGRTLDV
jgi:hypothetical protein